MKITSLFFLFLFGACSGGGGGSGSSGVEQGREEVINVSGELSALSGEVQGSNHGFSRSELDQLLAENVITEQEHQELLALVQE